jgi:hypothetical protein
MLSVLFACLLTAASLLGPGLARWDRGATPPARSVASSPAEHIRNQLDVVLMAAKDVAAHPLGTFDIAPETNLLSVAEDWLDPTEEVAVLADMTPLVLDVVPIFVGDEAANPNINRQYAEWSELRALRGQDPFDFAAFRDHVIAIGAPDPGAIG